MTKKLNITVTIDEDQLLALFTAAFKPFRSPPRSASVARIPSAEPDAIAMTKSGTLVRGYFGKLKPGRRVRVARVGAFLKKKGYSATTAMPICSASTAPGSSSAFRAAFTPPNQISLPNNNQGEVI